MLKKYFFAILPIILIFSACGGVDEAGGIAEEPVVPVIIEPAEEPGEPEHPAAPEPTPKPEPPRPIIALTFDDGPSLHTSVILDVLERYDGRATFFVIGNLVETHRGIVERAVGLGNEIANHTHTHARLTAQTDDNVIAEIQSASAAILAITGFSPPIYRPPFGATDDRIETLSAELGYGIVKWTLDPLDWRDRDADIIYDRIMSEVEDGSVIILHDIHATTAQAMERVIPSLIEQGFELVTVSELLEYRYGGLEAGSIFGSYCAWRIWDE